MSSQASFAFPDITRNRHGGNEESRAANERAHPHKATAYVEILNFVYHAWQDHTMNGATAKEYARSRGAELNTISGRFSELKAGGFLCKTRVRREGAAVLKLTGDGMQALQSFTQGKGYFTLSDNGAALFHERTT